MQQTTARQLTLLFVLTHPKHAWNWKSLCILLPAGPGTTTCKHACSSALPVSTHALSQLNSA